MMCFVATQSLCVVCFWLLTLTSSQSTAPHTLYFLNTDILANTPVTTFNSLDLSTFKFSTIETSEILPNDKLCVVGGIICNGIYYCSWQTDESVDGLTLYSGLYAINIKTGETIIAYTANSTQPYGQQEYGPLQCNGNTQNSFYTVAYDANYTNVGVSTLTIQGNKVIEKRIGMFTSVNGWIAPDRSNNMIDIYNGVLYATYLAPNKFDGLLRLMDIRTGKDLGSYPYTGSINMRLTGPMFLVPPSTIYQNCSKIYGMMIDVNGAPSYYEFTLNTNINKFVVTTDFGEIGGFIFSFNMYQFCNNINNNGYENYGFDISGGNGFSNIYRFNTTNGNMLNDYNIQQYFTQQTFLQALACL
eukprot:189219_1